LECFWAINDEQERINNKIIVNLIFI